MSRFIDLTGHSFGTLTASEAVIKNGRTYWLCQCSCGNPVKRLVYASNLRNGNTSSCGCVNKRRLRPYEFLYNRLKVYSAAIRDIPCEISYEDFLEYTKIDKCFYCLQDVSWNKYNSARGLAHHIDRKDNDKGYTKGNCVVCCTRCNRSKSDTFTFQEWYGMTEYFRRR